MKPVVDEVEDPWPTVSLKMIGIGLLVYFLWLNIKKTHHHQSQYIVSCINIHPPWTSLRIMLTGREKKPRNATLLKSQAEKSDLSIQCLRKDVNLGTRSFAKTQFAARPLFHHPVSHFCYHLWPQSSKITCKAMSFSRLWLVVAGPLSPHSQFNKGPVGPKCTATKNKSDPRLISPALTSVNTTPFCHYETLRSNTSALDSH